MIHMLEYVFQKVKKVNVKVFDIISSVSMNYVSVNVDSMKWIQSEPWTKNAIMTNAGTSGKN